MRVDRAPHSRLHGSGRGDPAADGIWGTAEKVPGTAALNQGGIATIYSASCATAGNCGAGGSYLDSSGSFQAFVVAKG
jgi:hypothetical protein